MTVRLLKQSRGEEQQAKERAEAASRLANASSSGVPSGDPPLDSGTATSAAIMKNLAQGKKNSSTETSATSGSPSNVNGGSQLYHAAGGMISPQSSKKIANAA